MLSFYTTIPKTMITCYTVPEIWRITDVIVIFYFGLFLPFYPPNSPKNQNFKKIKKTVGDTSFYTCVSKIMIRWCMVPEKWCVTDRQTDGQKKWHIEVGAPPKKQSGTSFWCIFIAWFFHKNVPYLILHEWTNFQCHTFSKYQTKCFIKFLLRQLMASSL